MATRIKTIENLASFIFGALILFTGLILSLYDQGASYVNGHYQSHFFPYQTTGIVLILIGVVFIGFGLFYSPRTKTSDDASSTKIPAPPP